MLYFLLLIGDVTAGSAAANVERAERLFLDAYASYAQGRLEEASGGFQTVHKLFPREPIGAIAAYNCAFLCSRLGQAEAALEWLEKAFSAGYDNIQHVEADGDLAAARTLPKYQEIMERARRAAARTRAPIYRYQHREFARKLIEAAQAGDTLRTYAVCSRLAWFAHEPTVDALNGLMRPEGFQIVNQNGTWRIDKMN